MRFSRTWHHPAQLEFRFEFALASPIETEGDDEDDEDSWAAVPFIRIVGPAAGKPAPKITAPRSVFDLAGMPFTLPPRGDEKAPEARYAAVVEVADGVRRCVGAAFPSRWTPEDEERERQRRARQRPPRPTKRARTRSKKLIELVGAED